MTGLTAQAPPVPAYCTGILKIRTDAQWQTCWQAGWHQPTTGAANAGYTFGHAAAPVLTGMIIVIALIVMARRMRSRKPATSR